MKATDFINIGLGAAFMAKDKLENVLKELERRGELSREEAKKFSEDASARAKEERKKLDDRIKDKVRETIAELNLATKEDIDELKKLIAKA